MKTGKTVFGDLETIKARTSGEPKSRSIRKNHTAMILLVQWSAHTLSFFIFMSSLALFAGNESGLQLDPQQLGLLLMISGFFQLFVRYVLFYPIMKKIGEKRIASVGLTIFPIVFFLAGFVQTPWHLVTILLGMSFAASSVRGVLTGFLSRSVDPRDQGTIQGYNTSLDTFAQIVGPLISSTTLMFWPLFAYGFIPSMIAIVPLLIIFIPIEFKYERMFQSKDDELSVEKIDETEISEES